MLRSASTLWGSGRSRDVLAVAIVSSPYFRLSAVELSTLHAKHRYRRDSLFTCTCIIAITIEGHNEETCGRLVDKKYLVDMAENSSKFKEFERTAVTRYS
jgi:hypothetical protein